MTEFYPFRPSKERPDVKALPVFRHLASDPSKYLADPGLVDAINVALVLGQPLLVSGEPGTGKTALAASIAWELGLEPPLVFETKSTSQARDLFYYYDTLGRFTAQQTGAALGAAQNYITFNSLGRAILLTNEPGAIADLLPPDFEHPGKRRSVVLIDEIEKAPRDFANDILNEIERLFFKIPELRNRRVEADAVLYPVVVLTNNSEKSLPDAFLRRCVYYNIPFPSGDRLEQIVLGRVPALLGAGPAAVLAKEAIAFVEKVRNDRFMLEKKPGTAELLNWLSAMVAGGAQVDKPLARQIEVGRRAVSALAKIAGDQAVVVEALTAGSDGQRRGG